MLAGEPLALFAGPSRPASRATWEVGHRVKPDPEKRTNRSTPVSPLPLLLTVEAAAATNGLTKVYLIGVDVADISGNAP